jgi:hypothetical protein
MSSSAASSSTHPHRPWCSMGRLRPPRTSPLYTAHKIIAEQAQRLTINLACTMT